MEFCESGAAYVNVVGISRGSKQENKVLKIHKGLVSVLSQDRKTVIFAIEAQNLAEVQQAQSDNRRVDFITNQGIVLSLIFGSVFIKH